MTKQPTCVNGKAISVAQAKALAALAVKPVLLENMDDRTVTALEKRGWATIEVEEVKITDEGREIARAIAAQAKTKPGPKPKAKAPRGDTSRRAKPTASPNWREHAIATLTAKREQIDRAIEAIRGLDS